MARGPRQRQGKDAEQDIRGLTAMAKARIRKDFVFCIKNRDCDDVEQGKVYPVLPNAKAKREGYLRVIDESGEDYLYPASYFVTVDLPAEARAALSAAS